MIYKQNLKLNTFRKENKLPDGRPRCGGAGSRRALARSEIRYNNQNIIYSTQQKHTIFNNWSFFLLIEILIKIFVTPG